jgi:hypothetical protein
MITEIAVGEGFVLALYLTGGELHAVKGHDEKRGGNRIGRSQGANRNYV